MRQVWWGFTPHPSTFSRKSGQKVSILIENSSLIAFFLESNEEKRIKISRNPLFHIRHYMHCKAKKVLITEKCTFFMY